MANMTRTTITGNGTVSNNDFKTVKWVGKTKAGLPVKIELSDAINMGNIDFTLADKNEVVPQVVYTATYSNTDEQSSDDDEPWKIEIDGTPASGAASILLGIGTFYIGNDAVALCRGGGQFTVTREYRNIEADGDRGPVKGRITIDSSVATLTLNALSIMNILTDLYSGVATSSTSVVIPNEN